MDDFESIHAVEFASLSDVFLAQVPKPLAEFGLRLEGWSWFGRGFLFWFFESFHCT